MEKHKSGFSLLELLMCVAIISILCSICIVGYQGSLDTTAIKEALPGISQTLNSYKDHARDKNVIVTVEFMIGSADMRVRMGNEDAYSTVSPGDIHGTLKRKLKFTNYLWPDGAKTPATFTFYPNSTVIGGTVKFGSAFSEGEIMLKNNHITWDM